MVIQSSRSIAVLLALSVGFVLACSPGVPTAVEPAPAAGEAAAPPSNAENALEAALATLEAPNAAQAEIGVVTAGQPTAADIDRLAEAGLKTVVNLRPASEVDTEAERAQVEALGLTYRHLPIRGQDDLTVANASALHELASDRSLHPMLIHCGSSNRVGALIALAAGHVEGLSTEEAVVRGRAAGLRSLEAIVRQRLPGDDAS